LNVIHLVDHRVLIVSQLGSRPTKDQKATHSDDRSCITPTKAVFGSLGVVLTELLREVRGFDGTLLFPGSLGFSLHGRKLR